MQIKEEVLGYSPNSWRIFLLTILHPTMINTFGVWKVNFGVFDLFN